jgi:uncharacterized heparinase superfamily protein
VNKNRSFYNAIWLYVNTVRYLKISQVLWRVLHRLVHPKPDLRSSPPLRKICGDWKSPANKQISMLSPSKFRFLNAEFELLLPKDWNSDQLPKLWLYNLHYFDCLNSIDAPFRNHWHRNLIDRWMVQNPPGTGCGWEPYPLSIRIVNWIKYALVGNKLEESMVHSLAVQIRLLSKRLEWHLLGNHILSNGKALIFGGCYFSGEEAKAWLCIGMSILERQIPEQVLPDGGHFERSTMYHALVMEDILDLVNLAHTFPDAFSPWKRVVESWSKTIPKMARWMMAMCHPDGEISFFNDAAIGISATPLVLCQYAHRLGVIVGPLSGDVIHLCDSGYIRVECGPAVLIIDSAKIGPDYLPGHAHADTLSFELSLYGKRLLVNSGISRYGLGPEREFERSTAAHNTVVVDGQNSSEVWAGFRVASRGYPFDVFVCREGDTVTVEAAHDGYCRIFKRTIHRRRWTIDANRLVVYDKVEGRSSEAIAHLYLHPETVIGDDGVCGEIQHLGQKVIWESTALKTTVETTKWHPEFGVSVPNKCIRMVFDSSNNNAKGVFTLIWS